MPRNFFTILMSFLLLLVSTLALLLWVRTTNTEQSTVAVNQELAALRQEFGQKKWQGYDIESSARKLQEFEVAYNSDDFATSAELLDDVQTALDTASLLYRDHSKSISKNPDNGNFLYLPWTTYNPFDREIEWATQRYDIFILTLSRKDYVQQIKTLNPDAEVYLYIDLPVRTELDALNDGLSSLSTNLQTHPDWFLSDNSGRPVTTNEVYTYY